MIYNTIQKNRWNRLRRNRPKTARNIESIFARPLEGSECFYLLRIKARASARRFKSAMRMEVKP